jgi:PadR family transcriptional regulator AphA
MEPTAVTWVVLGLLAQRPRTGYDIKAAVDRTIRHFWAASYGQIYPELRRLEAAGWVKGADASAGGRARREYRITAAGRRALVGWLNGAETTIEGRDESMLRLVFADQLPLDQALALLRARGERFGAFNAFLRSLDDGRGAPPEEPFLELVYRWALDFSEWGAEWCRRQERRLAQGG